MGYKKTNATGNVRKDSAPVLKKHVGLIHCENKLTFLQRKICNIFLFNALDGMDREEIHHIPLKQLCSLIGYRSNDINLIKRSIKSLISTVMEWNLLDDNKFINESNVSADAISWNASSLLAGASIEQGMVSYSYSPQIKTVLSSLEIYGRINLFVQAKFNSSYSLVLYENCVRFKTIGKTSLFKLDLFRALMGVMQKQYESFKELKRNVITVAVNEINQKSDIFVVPEYKKLGRSVAGIRFIITENENYQPSFKRVAKAIGDTDAQHPFSLSEILTTEFNFKEKQIKDLVSQYDHQYISEKIGLVRTSKNVENASAYLIAALKNDYKNSKNDKFNPQQSREVQTTYLRETSEASQIRSLKNKYIEYKFNCYLIFLRESSTLEKTQEKFILFLCAKNPIMGALYKKRGLQSPAAMAEFIDYVDQHYSENKIEVLAFDEFLTQEEMV